MVLLAELRDIRDLASAWTISSFPVGEVQRRNLSQSLHAKSVTHNFSLAQEVSTPGQWSCHLALHGSENMAVREQWQQIASPLLSDFLNPGEATESKAL